jgi:hypothetical protein
MIRTIGGFPGLPRGAIGRTTSPRGWSSIRPSTRGSTATILARPRRSVNPLRCAHQLLPKRRERPACPGRDLVREVDRCEPLSVNQRILPIPPAAIRRSCHRTREVDEVNVLVPGRCSPVGHPRAGQSCCGAHARRPRTRVVPRAHDQPGLSSTSRRAASSGISFSSMCPPAEARAQACVLCRSTRSS